MKERPILFSSPMVRAILDGRKTQTRRGVKPQPEKWIDSYKRSAHPLFWIPSGVFLCDPMGVLGKGSISSRGNSTPVKCPYGTVGDRLWVRETFASSQKDMVAYNADGLCGAVLYDERGPFLLEHGRVIEAEGYRECFPKEGARPYELAAYGGRWKPSIHMPRWASRITLEVTGVRVERLQSISEADAKAEGVGAGSLGHGGDKSRAVSEYMMLWDKINGKGSWAANPWVFVVEFKRALAEIANGENEQKEGT